MSVFIYEPIYLLTSTTSTTTSSTTTQPFPSETSEYPNNFYDILPGLTSERSDLVRAHHIFSRIPNFKCFFFQAQITITLAFNNLFWFLNENPFSLKKFRIQENMWWTHYRSLTQRYLTQIPSLFPLPETETLWIHRKII